MEETRELGDDGWRRGEVVDKDGAEVVEDIWKGRLCEEIGGERVDETVVQKPPSEVAATSYEEGTITWAPSSGAERVGVGALWGEGRRQETAGGLGDGSRERGVEGWDEMMG